jgi:two-component system OmpR family sensor kinase
MSTSFSIISCASSRFRAHQGVVSPFADPDDSVEVVVQIWDDSGTRLYLSHPRLDLPQRADHRVANTRIDGADWRVY